MYFPRFAFPWALLLLLAIPWSIYIGMKIRSLSGGRKWTAILLRSIILFCLIAALAGAEWVRKTDKLAVFFLLDQSDSVPEDVRLASAQAVRNAAEQYMTTKDEAGVIVFGDEASIELAVGPKLDLRKIYSYVGREQSDLAGALRLAMAAFPQGYKKRIVVLSDGNETRGSALEEVKLARSAGAAVDVVPLIIGGRNEVRLREVSAPGRVNASEPFRVRVVVQADQDCKATLRLFQRAGGAKRLLQPVEVTLQKGDNTFLLPQELSGAGFYEYEATVESDADTILANNESQAYTIVYGEPRVLYVEGNPEESTFIAPALLREGVKVDQVHATEIPVSLATFQNYDEVILSNVSSTDLSADQLKLIEVLERDLGIGLVMVGGPETFGAGGFQNTPVEKALPVSMDIKQRKILPRGALVLVLHTCEIPDGNAWARDIGLAALEVLSSQDLMGTLMYGGQGDSWLYTLQPVRDKVRMRQALRSAQPGDMPAVEPTLRMAYDALVGANAAVKRVVIISDGDPQGPSSGLLASFAAAKISISSVCIAPHSANSEEMLKWIAQRTGGNYYFVTDPQKLPQIFTKEAAIVKRGLVIEEPFTPKVMHDSELLQGLVEEGLPQLRGYVATSAKENATIPLVSHEQDPILAQWRYGLGKSVAFTSDATNRWAADWVSWKGFDRFWAQTVRWAMRELKPTGFRVETSAKDGMGHVRIDAVDEQGKFINFLKPEGVVTGPPPDLARENLSLMQTAPGIYEGSFPLGNRGLLEQLAIAGGGRVMQAEENPFDHNLPSSATVTPLWLSLVIIAACLFPFEIFVRRVVVDFGALWAFALAGMRKLPGLKRLVPHPKPRPIVATGTYGGVASREYAYASTGNEPNLSAGGAAPPAAQDGAETPVETPAAQVAARTEYTRQLLAAKQRAQEKQARRTGPITDDKDKENP
ncbi:MAG: glutamine amidotransferase [FCB group bacterium]|jgi:uncharacterized membrane protein|nr:glutamine amidotransferase [FCB group bacterium]